jgi:hypothetical protein
MYKCNFTCVLNGIFQLGPPTFQSRESLAGLKHLYAVVVTGIETLRKRPHTHLHMWLYCEEQAGWRFAPFRMLQADD